MKPHTLQTQSAPCELATLGCSQDDLGKGTTVVCQRRHGARISRVTGRGVRQVTRRGSGGGRRATVRTAEGRPSGSSLFVVCFYKRFLTWKSSDLFKCHMTL